MDQLQLSVEDFDAIATFYRIHGAHSHTNNGLVERPRHVLCRECHLMLEVIDDEDGE